MPWLTAAQSAVTGGLGLSVTPGRQWQKCQDAQLVNPERAALDGDPTQSVSAVVLYTQTAERQSL